MVISQDKSAMPGADVLAILISSDKHLDHVVNLTTAAFAKGKKVRLFLPEKACC